jgi:hypothetical protein
VSASVTVIDPIVLKSAGFEPAPPLGDVAASEHATVANSATAASAPRWKKRDML